MYNENDELRFPFLSDTGDPGRLSCDLVDTKGHTIFINQVVVGLLVGCLYEVKLILSVRK